MFMMMLMLMFMMMFVFWCKLSQVFGFFCVPVYLLVYVLKMCLRTNLCVRWCTHSGYVWVHTRGTRLYATYTRFVKNSVYIPRPQVTKKKCRIIPVTSTLVPTNMGHLLASSHEMRKSKSTLKLK